MNIGKVNCQELAYNVCSILGNWRVTSPESKENWGASITRADGLCLWITETKTSGKKPMVEISLDHRKSIPGIDNDFVLHADSHSVKCEGNPTAAASAIRVRLIQDAEQAFFKLRDEKETKDRQTRYCVQVLADLGQAIGYPPRGRDGEVERGYGRVNYERGGLSLDIEFTNYKGAFDLKGYCNRIPIDLMHRLIPVIEAWHAEKKQAAK